MRMEPHANRGNPLFTIGIDPTIELGPVTLAWHGLTIAIGLVVAFVVTRSEAKRRDLAREPLDTIALIVVSAAMVGARVFYLGERGLLFQPSEWLETTGFTF